jgi:hypothetical protein
MSTKQNKENDDKDKEKTKRSISIDTKKQVIDDVIGGISYDLIMEKFKFKNKSNISQIMSKKVQLSYYKVNKMQNIIFQEPKMLQIFFYKLPKN